GQAPEAGRPAAGKVPGRRPGGPGMINAIQARHYLLVTATERWAPIVAAAEGPPVIPARNVLTAPIDFGGVIDRFPAAFTAMQQETVRTAVQTRIRGATGEVIATNAKLLQLLGEMAFQSAARRGLIEPADEFSVSAFGGLTAL